MPALATEFFVPPLSIQVLDAPLSSRVFQPAVGIGVIQLEGRSLPYRPIPFEGRQRVKTTYYAGNTVATQQVMGPIEEPTTITGIWKDKFLGNDQAIALAENLDLIRRSGVQLQVTWGSFVRRGILARLKFPMDRFQDVAWEMEFQWNGRGNTVAPPITATGVQNPREGLTAVSNGLTEVRDAVTNYTDGVMARVYGFTQTTQIQFDVTINAALDLIGVIDSAASATTALASVPRYVLEQGIAVCKTARSSLQNFEESITDIPGELTHDYDLTKELKDSAQDLLQYLAQKLDILKLSTIQKEVAVNTLVELDGQLFPEILAEERPPAGTDLRDLANRHYGDPDLWFIIAQYNGIVGSQVPALPSGPSDNPARTIIIPRRQDGTLGDLRNGC
jgi:hypothetical protein